MVIQAATGLLVGVLYGDLACEARDLRVEQEILAWPCAWLY